MRGIYLPPLSSQPRSHTAPSLNIFTSTHPRRDQNSSMEVLHSQIQFYTESSLLVKCSVLATALGGVLCIYGLSLVIYRLYFDPLAGFPGPKIAAATAWYEFYHDVIRRGQYIYKIEEMHKKYGTVLSKTSGLSSVDLEFIFPHENEDNLTLLIMNRPNPPNKSLRDRNQ